MKIVWSRIKNEQYILRIFIKIENENLILFVPIINIYKIK